MKNKMILTGLTFLLLVSITYVSPVFSHCDTMDGPVIKAAEKALETGNINFVLIWVQPDAEEEIKRVFEYTLAVRKLSPEAKKLADRYFFETLVRVHRAGEGAPYTGLKPAELDFGPAIPAADKAVESGSAKEVLKILNDAVHSGLHKRFVHISENKNFDPDNVQAGREFVHAYVNFLHFVEGVFESTQTISHEHHSGESGAETHHDEH